MTQCRLCNLEINSNNCKNIFDEKHDPPLWQLIGKLSNIKVLESDPYTKLICSDCFIRLKKSCEFLEMILETDNKLRHTSLSEQHIKSEENHDCMSEIGDCDLDNCPPIEMDDDCDYILVEEDIEIVEHKLKFEDGADYVDDTVITNDEIDENIETYQNDTQIPNEITHNSMNNNNIDHKENEINNNDHTVEDDNNQIFESKYDNKSIDNQSPRKGYQCDFCNRRFRHKYHFNSHVLSHKNDVKPFRCSLCKREFRRKCHLFKHRRSCMGNYKG